MHAAESDGDCGRRPMRCEARAFTPPLGVRARGRSLAIRLYRPLTLSRRLRCARDAYHASGVAPPDDLARQMVLSPIVRAERRLLDSSRRSASSRRGDSSRSIELALLFL